MKWPFVPRAQHDAVLADRERIRGERNQFAEDLDGFKAAAEKSAALFAEADAANTRLTGRNKALNARLLEAQVASGFNPVAARRTAERIAALQKAAAEGREEAAKARAAAKRDRQRADQLQKELDNALGLPPGGPLSSAIWQPGYQAPTPDTKASAS